MQPARPASITAAATVGIILSSLGLLCNVIGLGMIAVQRAANSSGTLLQCPAG